MSFKSCRRKERSGYYKLNFSFRNPLRRQAWVEAAVEQEAWKVSFQKAQTCRLRAPMPPVIRTKTEPVLESCQMITSTWKILRKVFLVKGLQHEWTLDSFLFQGSFALYFFLLMCRYIFRVRWWIGHYG